MKTCKDCGVSLPKTLGRPRQRCKPCALERDAATARERTAKNWNGSERKRVYMKEYMKTYRPAYKAANPKKVGGYNVAMRARFERLGL